MQHHYQDFMVDKSLDKCKQSLQMGQKSMSISQNVLIYCFITHKSNNICCLLFCTYSYFLVVGKELVQGAEGCYPPLFFLSSQFNLTEPVEQDLRRDSSGVKRAVTCGCSLRVDALITVELLYMIYS